MNESISALPPCEICGDPGTHLIQDVKESPGDGEWIEWERDGKFHCYCDEHTRPPNYEMLSDQEQLEADMERLAVVRGFC